MRTFVILSFLSSNSAVTVTLLIPQPHPRPNFVGPVLFANFYQGRIILTMKPLMPKPPRVTDRILTVTLGLLMVRKRGGPIIKVLKITETLCLQESYKL